MPYTEEQLKVLKATDPNIVREALGRMTDEQRNDLKASLLAYNQKQAAPKPPERGFLGKIADNLLFNPVTQGITDMAAGGVQLAANVAALPGVLPGNLGEMARDYVNAGVRNREEAYQGLPMNQKGLAGVIRGLAGAVPLAIIPVAPVTGLAAKIGQGATMGAAAAMTQPVVLQPGQDDQFAGQKLEQGAWGGIVGGAIPAVTGLAGKGLRKLIGVTPKSAVVDAEASAQGIDLPPSKVLAASKETPREVLQAESAMKNMQGTLGKDMKEVPFLGMEDIKKAASSSGPRQARAQELLQMAERDGGAENVLQTSMGISSLQEKLRMEKLFGVRNGLAKGVEWDPSKAITFLDDYLEGARGIDASKWPQKEAAITRLRQLRDNLAATAREVPSKILDAQGNPFTHTEETPNTFMSGAKTRSDLGDALTDYYKGADQEIGKKGADVLQAVKKQIDASMSEAAQASGKPQLAAADKFARSEYQKFAGTFKDPVIVNAIHSSEPSKVMEALRRAGPERSQRVYDALDPKGKAAMAKGIFDEAMGKAYDPRTGDFIPGAVSAGIHNSMDALGVAVKGQNGTMLEGLNRAMQHLAKADSSNASALGSRFGQIAEEAPGKAGTVMAFLKRMKNGGIDTLFDSPRGKQFLFLAGTTKPGTPAMDALMTKYAPMLFASSAGRTASTPSPSQELQP